MNIALLTSDLQYIKYLRNGIYSDHLRVPCR